MVTRNTPLAKMTLGQLLDALKMPSKIEGAVNTETIKACLADEPLSSFSFSVRLYNILRRNEIRTISDLLLSTSRQLKRMRGMGIASYKELAMFLEAHNLKLSDEI